LMTIVPFVLMATLLSRPLVFEVAAVSTLSIGAAALGSALAPRVNVPLPATRWLIGGGVAVAVVCLGPAFAGGSRLDEMLTSLLFFAARVPQIFAIPIGVHPVVVIWAAALFALAVLSVRKGAHAGASALGRVAAGLFTWVSILLLASPVYLLALPLAWLATRAPQNDRDSPVDSYCRVLLPALALLESLQAYPVAGTQVSLAGLGLMPVGAILIIDGVRQLELEGSALARWIPRSALAASLAIVVVYGVAIAAGFNRDTPLGLPGAESVRLGAQQRADLRDVVSALDRNGCTYLITYPGMDSFYIWTSETSATQMRYEMWWLTIGGSEQAALVKQLESQRGLCVLRDARLVDFWTRRGPAPSGPLVDYVNSGFVPAATYGDYELLVRASS
jgi:hypothetical protein